jgi:WhiB family redox-sensing transcriptional regulator
MLSSDLISGRDWTATALCAQIDPDMWFPESARSPEVKEAKAICNACPVKTECAAYADEVDAEYGIWAGVLRGTTERSSRPWRREGRWEGE